MGCSDAQEWRMFHRYHRRGAVLLITAPSYYLNSQGFMK